MSPAATMAVFPHFSRGSCQSTSESTVRYLGFDIEDALALAEGTEV